MVGISKSILVEESLKFSLECIGLYKKLVEDKEFILSKQFLRSATSIGANIRESRYAESSKDFVHKFKIALKECNETLYWLELLKYYDIKHTNEIDKLRVKCNYILKMICKSINTCNLK